MLHAGSGKRSARSRFSSSDANSLQSDFSSEMSISNWDLNADGGLPLWWPNREVREMELETNMFAKETSLKIALD